MFYKQDLCANGKGGMWGRGCSVNVKVDFAAAVVVESVVAMFSYFQPEANNVHLLATANWRC